MKNQLHGFIRLDRVFVAVSRFIGIVSTLGANVEAMAGRFLSEAPLLSVPQSSWLPFP